jgi:5,10-methylenetetrahydromethanopterin reductase
LTVRYGVTLQGIEEPAAFGGLAAWIEDLGFDDLWITDSSLHAGDVFVYAALALQATSRLVVGTAVTNPLTRHPAIVANAFRSLAQLAPGRVVCGIGVGDRPLVKLDLPMAKLETLERSIDVMRALWRGETVTGRVGRSRLAGAHLRSPVDELPVHIAASGPRALELTGRIADGAIILPGLFPEGLAYAREHLDKGRAASARPSLDTVCFLYGAIDEDERAALDAARPIAAWFPKTAPAYARLAGMSEELIAAVVGAYEGQEFQDAAAAARLIPDDLVRRIAFAGTPAAAERKLDWLRETGIDAVSVFPLGAGRRETIAAFAQIALTPA